MSWSKHHWGPPGGPQQRLTGRRPILGFAMTKPGRLEPIGPARTASASWGIISEYTASKDSNACTSCRSLPGGTAAGRERKIFSPNGRSGRTLAQKRRKKRCRTKVASHFAIAKKQGDVDDNQYVDGPFGQS